MSVIFALTELAPLGTADWDYEDKRRVVIQFIMLVTEPGYVPPILLQQVVSQAGRLCGLGDFRPTYGRFMVTRFEVIED